MKFKEIMKAFLEYRGYAETYGNTGVVEECDKILAKKEKGRRKRIAYAFKMMQASGATPGDKGNQLYNLGPDFLHPEGQIALDAWVAEQKRMKELDEDIELDSPED
jgi:hypothetical protein